MSAIVFLKFSKMANQPVDFNQLDKLISALVENENKHIREDEAKFRAMEQATSYEQFQDYVKTAHLKPVDLKDKRPLTASRPLDLSRFEAQPFWTTICKNKE